MPDRGRRLGTVLRICASTHQLEQVRINRGYKERKTAYSSFPFRHFRSWLLRVVVDCQYAPKTARVGAQMLDSVGRKQTHQYIVTNLIMSQKTRRVLAPQNNRILATSFEP